MPKAAPLNDIGSGHDGFPSSNTIAASGDVFINGRPAARVSDPLAPPAFNKGSPHARKIAAGSSYVFITGLAAAREGDAIHCGGVIITGSDNVLIGG